MARDPPPAPSLVHATIHPMKVEPNAERVVEGIRSRLERYDPFLAMTALVTIGLVFARAVNIL
jgi:hypothetical protein